MIWSAAYPLAEGWYWMRLNGHRASSKIVRVYSVGPVRLINLRVAMGRSDSLLTTYREGQYEYAGPLEMPEN